MLCVQPLLARFICAGFITHLRGIIAHMLLDKRCTSTLFCRYYSLEIKDPQKNGVSQSIDPNTVQLSRMEGPNGLIPLLEHK